MDKALLIIDVQNDFVTGSLGSEYAEKAVVPNIVKLCEEFNSSDIYATLDTHFSDYNETLEGKKLPVAHCISGTKGHELVEELQKILCKDSYLDRISHIILKGTFGAPNDILSDTFNRYDEIHICGLCTDICVVSNALILRALFPNKPIIVHENCCGGTSKKAHDAAIITMKSCQIDIV